MEEESKVMGRSNSSQNGDWHNEKDNYLKSLVNVHGTKNWELIASIMNVTFLDSIKTPFDCKDRYFNYLDPGLGKKPWSDKEEFELLVAQKRFQNRWSDVATALRGRSNNTIKNRFYSIFRKVKNKIKKIETSYLSKLELLEIYYMISIMEYYIAHPDNIEEHKGRRGKDYIYTLLHNLTQDEINVYKERLSLQIGNFQNLERLWSELNTELLQNDVSNRVEACAPRSNLTLPAPIQQHNPELLTTDEKNFVFSQMIQRRESSSASTPLYQQMMLSPNTQVIPPFSASYPLLLHSQLAYEGFSDFTNMPTNQYVQSSQLIFQSFPVELPQIMQQQNMLIPRVNPPHFQ